MTGLRTLATRVAFLVAGISMSAWAPLVPLAKARTGLDEAALGLVLLCFGTGSLIAMPLAGLYAARLGCRRVVLASAATLCLVLPLLAIVDHPVALALVLLVFGAGLGGIDVAMNLQAIAVERASGRAMMSGFHGMYSIGCIVGASGVALALSTGLDAIAIVVALSVAMAVAIGLVARGLLADVTRDRAARFALPRGIVLVVGLLTCAAFLVEGAVLDWSAVFLTQVRGVDVAHAGAGYIAFAIAMTALRLTGDRVVTALGARRVFAGGALLAAFGIALAACVPSWVATVAGFACVGVGCANIVPILFTAAGRQTVMPESLAVPTMTTMGYAGLLAGPALIGFASHATSLSTTFVGLAAMMIVVAFAGRRLAD